MYSCCNVVFVKFSDLELRKAFSLFDQSKGAIVPDDVICVMKKMGQNPSEEDVQKMIQRVTKNGKSKH